MPDSATVILVCSCGKRIKAAGASPGRLGRCPKCGALLRVPDAAPVAIVEAPLSSTLDLKPEVATDEPADDRLSFDTVSDVGAARRIERLARARTESEIGGAAPAGWVFSPPKSPETTLAVSVLYPFWDWSGVGLLLFTAPITAFLLELLIRLSFYLTFLNYFTAPAFAVAIGSAFILTLVLGQTFYHMELFLIDTSAGSPAHPARPDFEVFQALTHLGRWIWAGIMGLVFGGAAGVAYLCTMGNVVRFGDRLAIAALFSLGAIGGPIALLAATRFGTVRAAGPFTVLRSLIVLGVTYVRPCLVAAGSIAITCFLLTFVAEIGSPIAQALFVLLICEFAVAAALVSIRVLGLCQFRNADQ